MRGARGLGAGGGRSGKSVFDFRSERRGGKGEEQRGRERERVGAGMALHCCPRKYAINFCLRSPRGNANTRGDFAGVIRKWRGIPRALCRFPPPFLLAPPFPVSLFRNARHFALSTHADMETRDEPDYRPINLLAKDRQR